MAQEFSYAFKSAIPLPTGLHDESYPGSTLGVIRVTGPASSVEAGMTIADIEDDFSVVQMLIPVSRAQDNYRLHYTPGANNAAATGKIIVTTGSTGAALTADTDLSSLSWDCLVIGSGPVASGVD